MPVAFEIAKSLGATLDVLVVRKLGAPLQPELAIGAIASGGIRVLNEELVAMVPGVDDATIDDIAERETRELRRRETVYRGDRPYPDLEGRDIVLVDDGLATGATMRAAVAAVKASRPAKVVVAVPVGAEQAVKLLADEADDVICLDTPSPFGAIGFFYRNFSQTSDDEVRECLDAAAKRASTQ